MILSIIPQRLNHKAGLDCCAAIQRVLGLAKFCGDRSPAPDYKNAESKHLLVPADRS